MPNPINESGILLEEECRKELLKRGIAFQHQTNGKFEIDFIIGDIYADCTNQNGSGSVEEKLPHKVWKYWDKYDFDEVYIIRGDHMIGDKVIKHLDWYEEQGIFTTHIVTLNEFLEMIDNTSLTQAPLDMFFA